jgi:hypothetical protein
MVRNSVNKIEHNHNDFNLNCIFRLGFELHSPSDSKMSMRIWHNVTFIHNGK